MDVEKILNGAVRFSNFISVRLVFFAGLSLLVFPMFGAKSVDTQSLLAAFPLAEELIENYKATIDALGIKSVAVYLIFFVFITVLHLSYSTATTIGAWLPPHLGLDTLQSVERNFNRDVVDTLKDRKIDSEQIARFSESVFGKHSALDESLVTKIDGSNQQFNASKTFLVLAFVALVLISPDYRLDMLSEKRATVIGLLLLICICYWHYLIRVNRLAFERLQTGLEHSIEISLRPKVDERTYVNLVQVCERHRTNFKWYFDWLLPVVGSLRYWIERLSRKFGKDTQ